jgi:hypothetical protein
MGYEVSLKPMSGSRTIYINRAPVLTLWAAVVAERLGFRRDESLTLGRAVAGLNAYSKGVSLGLFHPSPKSVKDRRKRLSRGRRLKVDRWRNRGGRSGFGSGRLGGRSDRPDQGCPRRRYRGRTR